MAWPWTSKDPNSTRKAAVEAAARTHFEQENHWRKLFRANYNDLEYFLSTLQQLRRTSGLVGMLSVFALPFRALSKAASGIGAIPFPAVPAGFPAPVRVLGKIGRTAGALALVGSTASAAVVTFYWPQVGKDIAIIEENLGCVEAHLLLDNEGYAGALPVEPCTEKLAVSSGFDDDTTDRFLQAFSAIEGGVSRADTVLGQDLKGYLRYALANMPGAQALAKTVGLEFTRGGSSGFQTMAEFFHGSPQSLTLTEKPRMLVMGMRLSLTLMDNDEARAKAVSRLPAIAGYGGHPIGGSHASRILFGHDPVEWWEICLQAAAAGKPMLLSMQPVLEDGKRASVRRAQGRAESCVRALADDPIDREAQLGELHAWTAPMVPDPSQLDPALRRHARAELRLAQRDNVAQTLILTTSRKAQSEIIGAGDIVAGSKAFAPIAKALPDGSCLADTNCDNPVTFAFAVAELLDDKLVPRAVRTNATGAIFGALRKGTNGFERVAAAMGQASISKLVHILVAADHNVQSLCSKRRGQLRDYDGFEGVSDCNDAFGPPERRSVATAIAWSANLGFAHLVERFPEDFKRFHEAFGWLGEMTVEDTIGATLGLGPQPAGPADMMQLLAAIENGRAHPLGMFETDSRPLENGRIIDLEALGLDEAELRRARLWLSKPVSVGTLKGTVSAINWPANCAPHLGKTGTNFDKPRRLSKNLVMSVKCGNRTFVVYGGVWTGNQATGSVGDLTHVSLAPMLEASMRAALKN